MKWEYLFFSVSYMGDNLDEFNSLGADGWELVTIAEGRVYFKRPILPELKTTGIVQPHPSTVDFDWSVTA